MKMYLVGTDASIVLSIRKQERKIRSLARWILIKECMLRMRGDNKVNSKMEALCADYKLEVEILLGLEDALAEHRGIKES